MSALRFLSVSIALAMVAAIGAPSQGFSQQDQGIRVVVDNHSFYDMHIYVLQSGLKRSLGMATGLSKRTFELPESFAYSDRDTRILADPIGYRGGYVSQVLFLDPGEQLNITLQNYLGLSTTVVSDQPPSEGSEDSEGGSESPAGASDRALG